MTNRDPDGEVAFIITNIILKKTVGNADVLMNVLALDNVTEFH
jgi:hypothetical protein